MAGGIFSKRWITDVVAGVIAGEVQGAVGSGGGAIHAA
jgi:hypothetical protein